MKRWLLILAVGALIIVSRPVQAADWSITKFSTDIVVKTDASIDVVETINTDFSVAKHGIFRTIPVTYQTTNGGSSTIPITITGVTQDGRDAKYTEDISGPNMVLKIGDANRTITGAHEYKITYVAKAAVNFFTDHDELYWNATGNDWEVPLANVTAAIHLPGTVAVKDITLACYTGAAGSTASNCTKTYANNAATYTAQDFLTIVAGWPTGIVVKPSDYDAIRSSTVSNTAVSFLGLSSGWWALNVIIPILTLVFLFYWWNTHGRDPKGRGTIIAQYEPPTDLRPAEMDVVLHETFRKAAIPATIIDLAVRGYLKITEQEETHVFGLSHTKSYSLTKLKEYQDDATLRDYEKYLLDGIFTEAPTSSSIFDQQQLQMKKVKSMLTQAKNSPWSASGQPARTTVALKDLKTSFLYTNQLVQQSVTNAMTTQGYFVAGSLKQRTTFGVIGAIMVYASAQFFGLTFFGLILAGILVACYGFVASKRTPKGVEALWQARGFKLFLEKAEKYRLQWQEKQNIFETYLPYAMVFGVAEKWSQALASLNTTPPSWYEGQSNTAFNTVVLWSALNSFTSTAMSTVVSPAASGGSGFGGGGFSGGGGGGGGGGSW